MFLAKKINCFLAIFLTFFLLVTQVSAEEKASNFGKIPKLPKTPNDPFLYDGHVYPN